MSTMTEVPEQSTDSEQVDHTDGGLGAQAAPWGVMGALVMAAGACRIAANATGAEQETALTVAGVAFTAAVVTAWATRRRITDRRMRHRFVAALYLAAGWLTAVTATGLSWGAVAALVVFGSGLSLLWWREHRIGPGIAPTVRVQDDDMFVTRWADNLGAKGRQFAGSRLTNPQIIKAGYRYTLRLVPGVHTVSQVRAATETLRSGLGLMPGQEVIVEAHPDLAAPNALLTVVTKSPITKSVLWPGPTAFNPDTGCVDLGPHVDGEGVARWRVYTDNSLWGGYMTGSTGSGKSRMFESLAMSIAANPTHPTVVWFIDGDEGASSPMLTEYADYVAVDQGLRQARKMLEAALRLMQVRRAENTAYKIKGFKPTADRPGLVLFIDECHIIFADPELRAMAAEIARRGRKVGIAIIAASQVGTLDAFGGSGGPADVLRGSLRAGNVVLLRSMTNNTKQVFGVDIDPTQFPDLAGYGYYLAGKGSKDRTAPFRGYYVTDRQCDEVPPRITWLMMPAGEDNVCGPEYRRRRQIAEQTRAEALQFIADMKAGRLPTLDVGRPVVAPSTGDFGDGIPAVHQVERFWMPEQPTEAGLSPGQQKVLDAIEAGHAQPKALREATGYSESQVYNLLDELKDLALVRKAGYGRYEVLHQAA